MVFTCQQRQKEIGTVCQCNKEKKGNIYLCVKNGAEISFRYWVIKFCVIFSSPFPFLRIPIPCLDSASASCNRVLSTCKLRGFSTRWGGGGLGSPLASFSPNTEISFLMISPYLLDFCPVFLLRFSPLETADFLMLFNPLGDGYSLLCSQKTASAAY